ncbi:MAG: Gfo/Idh/MocA family oxidoreductase, partial [Clostridia bacterium]|nr:Gfo/Idh/MocA family oxidoreductase [Clostridia bacterium]
MGKITRRDFIKKSGMGTAAFMIVPNVVLGRSHGHVAPSDKLNIAGVGVGGMGRRNLQKMSTENIVALCDVDWKYAGKTFNDYPNARRFKDWRVMLDEMGKSIDAVLVATPDHTHACVAAHAMTLGKHVYVQKPLTHSVYEARLLTRLAKKYKVATQMGNQGNSFDWCRQVSEWIWNDEIGEVREVHCWTDRPIWFQGHLAKQFANGKTMPPPKELDWDCWLGTAKYRDYPVDHPDGVRIPCKDQWARNKKGVFHKFNWRGFYDVGTGGFGDMACHTMNLPFRAAELGAVKSAECSDMCEWNDTAFPIKSRVKLVYAARESKARPGVTLPECTVYWSEGGFVPDDERLAPVMNLLRARADDEKAAGEEPLN